MARTDICAAELATWGVGPDVKKKETMPPYPYKELSLSVGAREKERKKTNATLPSELSLSVGARKNRKKKSNNATLPSGTKPERW